MPITTDAKIQELIVGGAITGFSIDTSILEQYKFGFEVGMLSKLQQFSRSGVNFVLSDMIWHEAEQHLVAEATLNQSQLKNALKPLSNSWGLDADARMRAIKELFSDKSAEDRTAERLDSFLKLTGCGLLVAEHYVKVGDVVSAYFDSGPPFSKKEKKKREFPDAIALLTLEGWAVQNGTHVLVVSKDRDWTAYCNTSSRIYVVDDLPRALALFNGSSEAALALFKIWARDEWATADDDLRDAVNFQIDDIEIEFEGYANFFYEEQLIESRVEDLFGLEEGLNSAETLDFQNNILSVQIPLRANVYVDFSLDFSHFDSVDKHYMSVGTARRKQVVGLGIDVILEVSFEQGQVSVEHIQLVPTGVTVEFGEVEPDWMNEPD